MKKKDSSSRFLSLILRHKPENIKIKLDKGGWVIIGDLLNQMKIYNREMDYDSLIKIVDTNDKKRFEIKGNDENGLKNFIRASQGHTVKVDLELKAERPPMKLYHGTINKNVDSIMVNGLNKMRRHGVHLSGDIPTAVNVGSRRGEAIILEINSGHMYSDGIKFYKSNNGVWLTEKVLPKYIKIII